MSIEYVVGLDLGGTNIKARLLDRQGAVCGACVLPTEALSGPDHVMKRMAEAVRTVCTSGNIPVSSLIGIGVAAPGPLDMNSGVILQSVNLPGWADVPLVRFLVESLGRPAILLNDASAAAFGEYWVGAGKGIDDLVMFTLGTGVGGGVISRGRCLFGHFEHGAELGHVIVQRNGRLCGCGQRGCLEAYASESHLNQRASELGVFSSDEDGGVPRLLEHVQSGSPAATQLWNECCESIATACVTLQHVLNPKMILLGGGMSAAGDLLLEPVRSAHASMVWKMVDDAPSIELAALGGSAGAIGAAGWFLHQSAAG